MALAEITFNSQCYFFLHTLQTPMSTKRSKVLWIGIAVNHIVYTHSGLPYNIAEDTEKIQIGIFKYTYHTVVLSCKILDNLATIAGQVAQVTLELILNETAFQQTCAQQLAYLREVFLVHLMTGDVLDMADIHNQDCKPTQLQYVHHSFPIAHHALHGYMSYA